MSSLHSLSHDFTLPESLAVRSAFSLPEACQVTDYLKAPSWDYQPSAACGRGPANPITVYSGLDYVRRAAAMFRASAEAGSDAAAPPAPRTAGVAS